MPPPQRDREDEAPLDSTLDDTIDASFPASDPPSSIPDPGEHEAPADDPRDPKP